MLGEPKVRPVLLDLELRRADLLAVAVQHAVAVRLRRGPRDLRDDVAGGDVLLRGAGAAEQQHGGKQE